MPVPLGRDDFAMLNGATSSSSSGPLNGDNRFLTFNHEDLVHYTDQIYQLNAGNAARHDVIDVHGSPGVVYPTLLDGQGRGYLRPLSARLFGEYMAQRAGWASPIANPAPIKLSVCYGGKPGWFSPSVGQTLATALGRTTQGARGTVSMVNGAAPGDWIQFL